MKPEPLEVTHGSGNVFRDFGYPDADVLHLKASLAGQIIKILDREGLSVRQAQARTGIAAADFSRIRNVDLKRFTVDRLMTTVNKLGTRIDLTMKFKSAPVYPVARKRRVPLATKPKAKYGSKSTKK